MVDRHFFVNSSCPTEWCWIRTNPSCFNWYYIYVVYALLWLAVFVLYVRVIRYIKQVLPFESVSPTLKSKSFAAQRHVVLYGVVFLVCWTPELFHRICELYDGLERDIEVCHWDIVIMIHGCTRASQGFLNAIIYGVFNTTFQSHVRKKMDETNLWWTQYHCCKNQEEVDENLSQEFLQKEPAQYSSFGEGVREPRKCSRTRDLLDDLHLCYNGASESGSNSTR